MKISRDDSYGDSRRYVNVRTANNCYKLLVARRRMNQNYNLSHNCQIMLKAKRKGRKSSVRLHIAHRSDSKRVYFLFFDFDFWFCYCFLFLFSFSFFVIF